MAAMTFYNPLSEDFKPLCSVSASDKLSYLWIYYLNCLPWIVSHVSVVPETTRLRLTHMGKTLRENCLDYATCIQNLSNTEILFDLKYGNVNTNRP